MADLNIKGGEDLDRALKNFSANVEKNILRGALRAGSKDFEREAKALVPFKSGTLRSSIHVSVRVMAGRIIASVIAGGKAGRLSLSKAFAAAKALNGKQDSSTGDAYYAHMVEGGTKPHEIRPKGKKSLFFAGIFKTLIHHPGAKARPFMTPAFNNKAQAAIDRVADYTRARIAKEATRK